MIQNKKTKNKYTYGLGVHPNADLGIVLSLSFDTTHIIWDIITDMMQLVIDMSRIDMSWEDISSTIMNVKCAPNESYSPTIPLAVRKIILQPDTILSNIQLLTSEEDISDVDILFSIIPCDTEMSKGDLAISISNNTFSDSSVDNSTNRLVSCFPLETLNKIERILVKEKDKALYNSLLFYSAVYPLMCDHLELVHLIDEYKGMYSIGKGPKYDEIKSIYASIGYVFTRKVPYDIYRETKGKRRTYING